MDPLTLKFSLVILLTHSLPYHSCDVSLENLVLDQLIIPKLIVFYIFIAFLLDIVLLL